MKAFNVTILESGDSVYEIMRRKKWQNLLDSADGFWNGGSRRARIADAALDPRNGFNDLILADFGTTLIFKCSTVKELEVRLKKVEEKEGLDSTTAP